MTILYKLIVSYNGFRFNGFQRQSSGEPLSETSRCRDAAADDTIRASTSASRAPKRPYYESKTGRPKGVPLTVQECIEQVLLEYTGLTSLADLQLRFAGRTDKGVHATGQVVTVHFPETIVPSSGKVIKTTLASTSSAASAEVSLSSSLASLKTCDIATWEIQKAINSRLPVDISIEHVECIGSTTLLQDPPLFDPRRHATLKQYSYTFKYLRKHQQQSEQEKLLLGGGIHIFRNALDPACMWHVPWALDDSILPQLCQTLQGTHDYSVFVHKKVRYDKSQVMTIDSINFEIIKEERIPRAHHPVSATLPCDDKTPCSATAATAVHVVTARLVFRAQGFRRTMVRNLVGFCVDRCRGSPAFGAPPATVANDVTTSAAAPPPPTCLWNDNQLWTFDTQTVEQVASKIHAAPASGLCLDHVLYSVNKGV